MNIFYVHTYWNHPIDEHTIIPIYLADEADTAIAELVEMLESITDDAEYYSGYAGEFLQHKHGVLERVEKVQALIKQYKQT